MQLPVWFKAEQELCYIFTQIILAYIFLIISCSFEANTNLSSNEIFRQNIGSLHSLPSNSCEGMDPTSAYDKLQHQTTLVLEGNHSTLQKCPRKWHKTTYDTISGMDKWDNFKRIIIFVPPHGRFLKKISPTIAWDIFFFKICNLGVTHWLICKVVPYPSLILCHK